MWSKAAAQSQWVRAEADFARLNSKLVQAHNFAPDNYLQVPLERWSGNLTANLGHVRYAPKADIGLTAIV